MNSSKLTPDEVIALKNKLPYGAMKKIADDLKINPDYVSAVLNNLKPYNRQIISKALDIVESEIEESQSTRERFEKLTKKAS